MKRSQFLWNILVGLAAFCILIGALRLNSMRKQVYRYSLEASQTQVGTDQRLNRTISFLENNLEARDAFRFRISTQPLMLTNVVVLSGNLMLAQQEKILRVTAIIGASQSTALVQYGGMNYRLSVGDTLAGGRVIQVESQKMVMQFDDKTVTFPVLGLSMSADEAAKYRIE